MTLPETLLWQRLRRRAGGAKFRRQHPVGPYVVDFYSPVGQLAVEIDGAAHDFGTRPLRDNVRDAFLTARRLTVLRVPASEVLRDPDAVADRIARAALPLHHAAARRGPPPHASHGEEPIIGAL